MNEDFARNLRLLCSYYRSIAEVCRRLGINRPQFNRYLSGRYLPAANTLRRFCDFFGVEEHEIMLPSAQFERLVQVRPRSSAAPATGAPEAPHLARLREIGSAGLDKYLGYYFETYLSMACPGRILRTLVCLERREEGIYYQRTERLIEHPREKAYHGIYLGTAHFLTDRIFLTDYETLTGLEITQTILFPSFKNRVTRLTGLKLGVSGSGERMPCCTRVVYEYLGPRIDVRRALRLCGLYEMDDPQIDEATRNAVTNTSAEGEWHFRARF
ncbi:helix-turn-helix transcriptional regulator [Thauera sp. CAU 1555]|uniref:Helix-turn-helix transcriptional regulator n=1 Tax=Thauera sedimentorum TaxID=2767595 RepID=A0ABR9B9H9_9RHOO|nr:helix-turn-helix transcriptional regulator [Thauera sedimentorum]MBC9071922.1 helix-turn-helix transcriptional regulator [Thauera sedimentorum]MBD8502841.1 helix-turn-helix transcriptional regulator [Thauera sedimentorum]